MNADPLDIGHGENKKSIAGLATGLRKSDTDVDEVGIGKAHRTFVVLRPVGDCIGPRAEVQSGSGVGWNDLDRMPSQVLQRNGVPRISVRDFVGW